MKSSIVKGAFGKWLENANAVVASVQVASSGGEVRLTSFCSRQPYAVPSWATWVVVAPAFWMACGGLTGAALYKAVNTADSMIGHRTPRHEAFGWAAARFDDLINLPASRLTALLFAAAAFFIEGASPRDAMRAVFRDAKHHRSPNAGWPEAAMAGALGIALAGPRSYGGQMIEARFMGEGGNPHLTVWHIHIALKLARIADAMLIGLFGLLALVIWLI